MSSQQRFRGTVVASLTPYNVDGSIDTKAVASLAQYYLAHGLRGAFSCGSTGEFFLLSPRQRQQVIATASAVLSGKATHFAGVADLGVTAILDRLREARDAGADVGVLTAPLGMSIEQSQLVDMMLRVADESPLPLGVYHHPAYPTRFELPGLAIMLRHPRVVAVKDSEEDLTRLDAILAMTDGTQVAMLTGKERFAFHCVTHGGQGSLTSFANFVPTWMAGIEREASAGNTAAARAWQDRVDAIFRDLIEADLKLPTLTRFTLMIRVFLAAKGLCSHHGFGGQLPDAAFIKQVTAIFTKHELL